MDGGWRREVDPVVLEGGIHMPYSWTVGRVASRFFIALRDTGRILASQCERCHVVWVPPRAMCPVCFVKIGDDRWTEVGPEGTLRHFTIARHEHPAQPMKPPFAYGLIDLDGAGTAIVHLISGGDPEDLRSGIRLRPVFRRDRQGNILDIAHFTPVGGQSP